ncbi:MAG: hypothetical protein KDK39_10895 [Leptospiraceae bacterium]|nr:hypothetical protein [Leptospiraceae bacterium]
MHKDRQTRRGLQSLQHDMEQLQLRIRQIQAVQERLKTRELERTVGRK